jgi:hypothetical protein
MLRGFASRFIFAAALIFAAPATAAPALKLPPGTRAEADHFISGRGLRDSTDFIAKELSKRGIAVEQIGPYRIRGVELTRFVSQALGTEWLAIHVLRVAGKTLIFFVPRPKALTNGAPAVSKSGTSIGDRLTAGRKTLTLAI